MAALPCGSPLTRTRSRRLRRRILLRSTVDRAVLPREALLLLRPLPVVRSVKKQLLLDYLVPPPDTVDSDPTDTLLKYFRDSNKTDPGADNRPCPVPARRALREPQICQEFLPIVETELSESLPAQRSTPDRREDAVAFRGYQIPSIVDMVFSSVVPAKGLSLDPLRSTAQALAAATWDAETIVTKEEVEKLVTNLTRACHKLQLTKGLKASYGGVDFTSFCPACPRPVHERDGYGEWCEYCYHEVRPQEVQSSRCSACRQLVNDELGFGEWCSSCFHEVRPLIYQSAGL